MKQNDVNFNAKIFYLDSKSVLQKNHYFWIQILFVHKKNSHHIVFAGNLLEDLLITRSSFNYKKGLMIFTIKLFSFILMRFYFVLSRGLGKSNLGCIRRLKQTYAA